MSFFTPVADKLRLKDSHSIHRPRLDIVEEKPRTRTIVVRLSSPGMSEGVQTLGKLNNFSSSKLKIHQIDHKNSVDVITTFLPMETTAKSSMSSSIVTNGSVPHQELVPNILPKDTNTKRPSVPCVSSNTPNRKSLFTNLIRRLSTPRNKISRTNNSSVLLTKGETGMSRSDSGSSNPSPRKLRRWFTKRMWKSAKLSDQIHGTRKYSFLHPWWMKTLNFFAYYHTPRKSIISNSLVFIVTVIKICNNIAEVCCPGRY